MAVGFEFATGWKVYRRRKRRFKSDIIENMPKGAVIRRENGWAMTVDGDEIEFVVEQVPESNAGRVALRNRMESLTRFVTRLNAHKGSPEIKSKVFGDLFRNQALLFQNDFVGENIAAIPQVTGGFRLGRIRKFLRILSDQNSTASKQFFGVNNSIYAPIYTRVNLDHRNIRDSNWKDHRPSAKLRGLVTLIATYIYRGRPPVARLPIKAAKYLYVVMSRTSFSRLFRELPAAEKAHYRAAPDGWVSFVCRDVLGQVPGLNGGVDPDGYLIGYLISDQNTLPSDQRVQIPITRREWLTGMLQGRDVLSAAANPITDANRATYEDTQPGLGHRLRGLAGLKNTMDDVTYNERNEKMAIIELRARQETLPYTEWTDYALRCYDLIEEVNEGDRFGVVDLKAPGTA